jgi:hypothetical protein
MGFVDSLSEAPRSVAEQATGLYVHGWLLPMDLELLNCCVVAAGYYLAAHLED